jgi:hypothetical protein
VWKLNRHHRMNRRSSSRSVGWMEQKRRKVDSSGKLCGPGQRATINLVVWNCRCMCRMIDVSRVAMATWRGGGTRWTDGPEKHVSVHPTVYFSVAVSQWLTWCLRLFIPPSLEYLRWLEWVEVRRSARHIKEHIHAILVLKCSSKGFARA